MQIFWIDASSPWKHRCDYRWQRPTIDSVWSHLSWHHVRLNVLKSSTHAHGSVNQWTQCPLEPIIDVLQSIDCDSDDEVRNLAPPIKNPWLFVLFRSKWVIGQSKWIGKCASKWMMRACASAWMIEAGAAKPVQWWSPIGPAKCFWVPLGSWIAFIQWPERYSFVLHSASGVIFEWLQTAVCMRGASSHFSFTAAVDRENSAREDVNEKLAAVKEEWLCSAEYPPPKAAMLGFSRSHSDCCYQIFHQN